MSPIENDDTEPTTELIKACIAALAQKDAGFRAALLANPRAAIESALGEPLPAQIEVNVVAEGPNSYTIVLPYESAVGENGELSDSDLEAVAGGSKSGALAFAKKVEGTLVQVGKIGAGIAGQYGITANNFKP